MSDPLTSDVLARVQEATATQPSLFSDDVDVQHGPVSAARRLFGTKTEPVHTGAIATRDEQLATAVLLALQAGMSRRQIRKRLGVHHYTIDAIEAAAEAGGRLEPLNTRVRAELGRLVLDAAQSVRESLNGDGREMEDAAWLKASATALGIGTDKHQLLTGAPTEILEHRSGPGRGDLEAWLAQSGLQVVSPAEAVDVQSPVESSNPLVYSGCECLHTDQTTEQGSDGGSVAAADQESKGPGGGSKRGRHPTRSMVQVSRKILMNDQSPPAFTQDEDAIAQNLGIDRSVVREKRGRRGVDFMRGEHGRYLWTEMAAANLALSLGVSCPEKAAPVLLIVANIALPSPTALACVEKGAPLSDRSEWKIVRVRPACRCLFLVGMEIMVEPLAYSAWKYVGPPEWTPTPNTPARYPRSRGKW